MNLKDRLTPALPIAALTALLLVPRSITVSPGLSGQRHLSRHRLRAGICARPVQLLRPPAQAARRPRAGLSPPVIAIVAQVLAAALVLWAAASVLIPAGRGVCSSLDRARGPATRLPWHVGQFMPTPLAPPHSPRLARRVAPALSRVRPCVDRRDRRGPGPYTHLPLLLASAAAAIRGSASRASPGAPA